MIASAVASLSSAAVYAGRAPWYWMLLWCGVGTLVMVLVLRRAQSGGALKMGGTIRVLYAVWAVVLSARVLSGAVGRLEQTSGGSSRFWLTVIFVIPLFLIGWGRSAPFFRMAEILWSAMTAVLVLVLALGIGKIDLRYILADVGDWRLAALGAVELLVPALYAIPYIYNVNAEGVIGSAGRLAVVSGVCTGMCLLTTGILGSAGEIVPHAFFVAAGVVGKTARMEGLLSAVWLLADFTLIGLLCRSWGDRRWPAVAVALSAAGNLLGISDVFSAEFYALGSPILLLVTVLAVGTRRNFVVKNEGENHI